MEMLPGRSKSHQRKGNKRKKKRPGNPGRLDHLVSISARGLTAAFLAGTSLADPLRAIALPRVNSMTSSMCLTG